MTERAELGIDGNCGFALLGEDLQSGEAEFVEIEHPGPTWCADYAEAAGRAASKAYRKLKDRLPDRQITYYLGPSHPWHC